MALTILNKFFFIVHLFIRLLEFGFFAVHVKNIILLSSKVCTPQGLQLPKPYKEISR